MKSLLEINDLSAQDIKNIWDLAAADNNAQDSANIAWSFEGNGIRTRTTFVQAFLQLQHSYVELPNVLKTHESVIDLAGYLDPFYDMYVIRDTNHQRMLAFSKATTKPVINAMSCDAHPCEVLTDGYYLNKQFPDLQSARILLWGPPTNVFNSWHALAQVLNLDMTHYCPAQYHSETSPVMYVDQLTEHYDVVITDAWAQDFNEKNYCLTLKMLSEIGDPLLLPTPPVRVGRELAVELKDIKHFVGYQQKALLLPVQKAIISYLLSQ